MTSVISSVILFHAHALQKSAGAGQWWPQNQLGWPQNTSRREKDRVLTSLKEKGILEEKQEDNRIYLRVNPTAV